MRKNKKRDKMENEYYLASFPKCGNTWVNFIIANMYNQLKGTFEEIDFFNIHEISPELQEGETKDPFFKDLPRVFMTHWQFKPSFENVILVIRNPWDVLYSYFHFLNGTRRKRKKKFSLPEVITHEKRGIRSLVAHNESFIKNCENLLIVTYENMHVTPEKEVRRIADFLGLEVDGEIIKTAIKKSSFKSMRKVEVKKGRRIETPGFLFTRSGKIGEGLKEIKKYKNLDEYILEEIKKSPLLYLLYG